MKRFFNSFSFKNAMAAMMFNSPAAINMPASTIKEYYDLLNKEALTVRNKSELSKAA